MTGESQPPSIGTLSRGIAEIGDPQIRRIVATVDALAARGVADNLIAPLRARLGTLRPVRPLRLVRLLFHPLDPLIVRPTGWRSAQGTVPRSAIVQMALVVSLGLGSKVAAIETAIRDRTIDDSELIMALGRSLWPEAGAILIRSEVPSGWTTTAFDAATYLELARKVGAVLSHAPKLDVLTVETSQGLLPPSTQAIAALLSETARIDLSALPMMTALLLHRLPQSRPLLPAIGTGAVATMIKTATDQAISMLLGHMERLEKSASLVSAPTLAASAANAGRIGLLLNEISDAHTTPALRSQIHGLHQRLEADCKAHFTGGLTAFLALLRDLPKPPQIRHLMDLERAARGLRMIESEARKFGNRSSYDLSLEQTADVIRGLPAEGALRLVDRIRLVEILAGSQAAQKMLEQA